MSSGKENDGKSENPSRYGYDLYPERRGTFTPTAASVIAMRGGTESIGKIKCEKNVYECVKNSPLVRLMMGALKRSGCQIDIRRHIACEVCDNTVTGGYDPEYNQIVVCQNNSKNVGTTQGVLVHEMIHMFDYCRNNLDFKNLEHLACTEIRAANLTHCSITNAFSQGDAGFLSLKEAHKRCVKTKALFSVLAVRQINIEEANKIVNKVFPKCYADLEPIGRRIRRGSVDLKNAYIEGFLYGYDL